MSGQIVVPFSLKEIATRCGRSKSTVYKWKYRGRKNRHTGLRVYPEFTWLPSGEWGMTQSQYDEFVAALNRKP